MLRRTVAIIVLNGILASAVLSEEPHYPIPFLSLSYGGFWLSSLNTFDPADSRFSTGPEGQLGLSLSRKFHLSLSGGYFSLSGTKVSNVEFFGYPPGTKSVVTTTFSELMINPEFEFLTAGHTLKALMRFGAHIALIRIHQESEYLFTQPPDPRDRSPLTPIPVESKKEAGGIFLALGLEREIGTPQFSVIACATYNYTLTPLTESNVNYSTVAATIGLRYRFALIDG